MAIPDEGYAKGRRMNRPLGYKRQLPAEVGLHDADAGRDGQGRENEFQINARDG